MLLVTLDFHLDFSTYSSLVLNIMPEVTISNGIQEPKVVGAPRKSWTMNYTVLCFIMNGQLYAKYKRIGGMLGLPSCSEKQWRRIIEWLEKHITSLADWTWEQLREQVRQRGDQESCIIGRALQMEWRLTCLMRSSGSG